MVHRQLGNTGMAVSPIGFGAFKIGRNQKTKYGYAYDLPGDDEVDRLLNCVLDIGVNLIDTAPAYGTSEQRIGKCIAHRRSEFVLSTKVGERFSDGQSNYDYGTKSVTDDIRRSLANLRTDTLDIVFVHSNGDDLNILNRTDVVATLDEFRSKGVIRAIGFSGKDPLAERQALQWADVLMVEFDMENTERGDVIREAARAGTGVVVKKGLASGRLNPAQAISFVLQNSDVDTMVVGGLNLNHIRDNCAVAGQVLASR